MIHVHIYEGLRNGELGVVDFVFVDFDFTLELFDFDLHDGDFVGENIDFVGETVAFALKACCFFRNLSPFSGELFFVSA